MRESVRAGLAVIMLACVSTIAVAAGSEDWLSDPQSACAVLGTGSGDRVAWTGACEEGFATGLGTATFFKNGKEVESFTADFERGMVADGHVITRWGDGWSYHGEQKAGRFNGGGVLVNDKQDRFLGVWTDGKMNGFGLLDRSDGSRYAGEWQDSLPNGEGELRRADGSIVAGLFNGGRLVETRTARADSAFRTAAMTSNAAPTPSLPKSEVPKIDGPFASLAGVRLRGADGSVVALSPIEGGIEMALTPPGGVPQKTTFTFMTDKMGTVVEDGSGHGANVTGFFRLTSDGVELHYADGRAETMAAGAGGGVTVVSNGPRISCRSWYPEGHVFSETEKRAALADYAVRLGLPVTDSETKSGCPAAPSVKNAVTPPAPTPAPKVQPATARVQPATASKPGKSVKTSYAPSTPNTLGPMTAVPVRNSQVHALDESLPPAMAAAGAGPVAKPDGTDPSRCLKVESDGLNWGFRNNCDFPVQFAYCLLAEKGLTGCTNGGAPGSVASKGFGALIADHSLSSNGADHKFRWIACAGGSGEVIARLEQADPPSGRCERNGAAITAAK